MSKYDLKMIEPELIAFNERNPRGESESEIKGDPEFEQLRSSVGKYGVLVPVVVHRRASDGKQYVLVDGERRLRAALATGIRRIPAHVAPADDALDEHVQAFHIHMLRKQWKPVATVRGLKRIRIELKRQNTNRSEQEILEELQTATGCTPAQLQDLRRGSRYSTTVLDDVDSGKLKWSNLVQFEASFIEQLQDRYPEVLKELGVDKIRDALVAKAKTRVLTNTRVFIDFVTPVMLRARTPSEREEAARLFKQFVRDEAMRAEDVKRLYDQSFPAPQDVLTTAESVLALGDAMLADLEQLDVNQLASYPAQTGAARHRLRRRIPALRRPGQEARPRPQL